MKHEGVVLRAAFHTSGGITAIDSYSSHPSPMFCVHLFIWRPGSLAGELPASLSALNSWGAMAHPVTELPKRRHKLISTVYGVKRHLISVTAPVSRFFALIDHDLLRILALGTVVTEEVVPDGMGRSVDC